MAGPTIATAAERSDPEPIERLTRPFLRFAQLSSAGGIVLIVCTLVALVWANSGAHESYHTLFHGDKLELRFGTFGFSYPLGHWINDALMALFFFVVGLEIKREILVGELASPRKAALPIAAAVGGMVGPALIFAAINWGQPTLRGWGVPMATDIAFALGVLSLLGKRVPTSLKVFLTSLAIADDLGALLVIALFYTEKLSTDYLMYSGVVVMAMFACNMLRVRRPLVYFLLGVVLWVLVYKSGVHATIAGVLGALTIPASERVGAAKYLRASREALDVFERYSEDPEHDVKTSPGQRAAVWAVHQSSLQAIPALHRLEHMLHPWTAFFVIPVFALANAGVELHGDIGQTLGSRNTIGVIAGLVVGKPVGILLACLVAVKLRLAALPTGVGWRHVLGVGFLGGIGFTMALFIANLAFAASPEELEHAKLGILLASLASAAVGLAVLATAKPAPDQGA